MKNIKMNQEVYIIIPSFEKFAIVKGTIVGCVQTSGDIYRLRYIVETALGRRERFSNAIYKSPKEIADNIGNYVVEEPSEAE